jgi:hypothetical protein
MTLLYVYRYVLSIPSHGRLISPCQRKVSGRIVICDVFPKLKMFLNMSLEHNIWYLLYDDGYKLHAIRVGRCVRLCL